MSAIRLSMPVAFLIENCLTSGLSHPSIIDALDRKDFTIFKDKVIDPDMDFADRLEIASDLNEDWQQAIVNGYQMKHLHLNGLKKLLNYRFNKKENIDYHQKDLTIIKLQLDNQELLLLERMIQGQWCIKHEANEGYQICLRYST
ncbi:hypothetical protein [Amphibacillus cookii]|uniref:hypothetical protein n=1 Tax=Amphibacillus cookii TaxID=767787 RepID=UPI00195C9E88|nr:hypothetical protein [Amphibacillus cookii]MBM7542211.1 hypothetical protein [Amphibacillus cookii]